MEAARAVELHLQNMRDQSKFYDVFAIRQLLSLARQQRPPNSTF